MVMVDQAHHTLVAATGPQLGHLADDGAVPALGPPACQLRLPQLPDGGVGAAHQLVGLGAFLAFQSPDLGLELPAPDRLGVVESLVRPAVTALAAHEDV